MEKMLFLKGLFLVHFFDISIKIFTIKFITYLLKSSITNIQVKNEKTHIKKMLQKTIRRNFRFSFWNSSCLAKAMMIKTLYNSYDIHCKLVLSLKKTKDPVLEAHAYVELENNMTFLRKRNYFNIYAIE